jgi:pyrroline-5-carboxylate reductase
MKISNCHLGFIGFGHMAEAIFQAIDRSKLVPRSQVSFIRRDPVKMRKNEQDFRITSTSLESLLKKSDILILGVRPMHAKLVMEEIQKLKLDSSKLIITLLAGVKIAFYRKYLSNPIIRVMPNIASEVGMGMSVISHSKNVSKEAQELSRALFSCMGEVMEVPEEMMDISCAIAGSGPGFVFRLIESVAKEGERKGLAFADALKMAAQAFMGAAKLVLKKQNVENLITQIATPNGTTEAGLKKMAELKMDEHIHAVIAASARRSKELSEEFQ